MNWYDVRFICLVKVEIGTSGAEEGGEDEINLTIRNTIQVNPIDKQAKIKGRLTSFPNNTANPLKRE